MSNTYVKKYDVGQINLDLPYANYIHELPLLSFGDVQHTINLSLVFNYARKAEGDNSFNIANGFKLNMQKKIIINGNDTPIKFYDSNGKNVQLTQFGDVFTFDDDSQRILRRTQLLNMPSVPGSDITEESGTVQYTYTVEYPDFSREDYDSDGIIIASYDKYGNSSPVTYAYNEDDRLESITYGSKIITLVYASNNLSKIVYANTQIEFSYGTNKVIVTRDSGVTYELSLSGVDYTAKGSSTEGETFVSYSKELKYSSENSVITVYNKVGTQTIDTVTYSFPNEWCDESNTFDHVVITDNNGVKTRVQYKNAKMLYSYEIADDAVFVDNKFAGNVSIYNTLDTLNVAQGSGKLTINDGTAMTPESGNPSRLTCSGVYLDGVKGYYFLTGWAKIINENVTGDQNCICISDNIFDGDNETKIEMATGCTNQWQFFAYKFYYDAGIIYVYPKSTSTIELKDVRMTYQITEADIEKENLHIALSEQVLLNGNNKIPFVDAKFYYSVGNDYIEVQGVTIADVMRFKLTKKKYGVCSEIYYNNSKNIIPNVQYMTVLYNNSYVSINDFDLGISGYVNNKAIVTRINIDENNANSSIVKTVSVDGTIVSTETLNKNLDVISSTVDGITTYYERNANGLVTKEEVIGLYLYKTAYGNNEITVSDIKEEADEDSGDLIEHIICQKKYYLDSVWGCVDRVEVLDGNGNIVSVVDNTYDSECTLTGKAFGNRANSFGYSNGKLQLMTNGALDYTFEYTNKDELKRISKNTASIEHHTYTTIEGNKTQVESKYPSESAIYTEKTIFDKYGRLKSIDGMLENVYYINSYYRYEDPEDGNKIKTDIENYDRSKHGELEFVATDLDSKDSVLSETTDKVTNETVKYGYEGDNLVAAVTYNANDAVLKQEIFTYDDANRLTKDKFTYEIMNPQTVESEISYVRNENDALVDDRVNSYTYKVNGAVKVQTSNTFGVPYNNMLNKKTHTIGGKSFSKQMFYNRNKVNATLDKCGDTHLATTAYTYDAIGRIASVATGGYTTSYSYDEYGQLTQENNQGLDKTFQYVYNTNTGNLDKVIVDGVETAFVYDSAHPDRLTRCGYKNITYNSLGCPITYGSKHLDWANGKLTKYYDEEDPYGFDSSESTEFTYNGFGQRVRKEYSYYPGSDYSGDFPIGKEVNYDYDHSGRLIREISTEYFTESASETVELIFLYDESGMIGFMHSRNGSTPQAYYYQRNLQGDVVAIYDTNGTKVAGYAYDAYGNCTITSSTNYTLARNNPIRYRGYYYDEDTELYYLNSRYYSPEFRRFISPDDTNYLDPENVNGLNLYCYCGNDPVNYADPSGHSVVAVITIIGLTLGVAGGLGYAAYTDYQDDYIVNGSIGWQTYLGYGLIGGAIGAGIGFTISYFGGSAISSYIGGALSSIGGSQALAIAGGGTASVASACIAGGALIGIGILYLIPMKGKPNSTIKSGGSYGEYDENGNLKYRVDTTGKPHFIKKYQKYFLPHVHKFDWYLRDGIWRFIEEVWPHL